MVRSVFLGLLAFIAVTFQPISIGGYTTLGSGPAAAGVVSKAIKARVAYGIAKHVIKRRASSYGRMAGSIRKVNPNFGKPGFTQNCVNCAIATDRTLAGNASSAMPTRGPVDIRVLERTLGGRIGPNLSKNAMNSQIASLPNGSRGVVIGSYRAAEPGHAFNFVKQNGKIRYLDGQSGKMADLTQMTSFRLMRTK